MKKAFQCIICGYIHVGNEPPKTCPICGAAKEEFEPYTSPAEDETFIGAAGATGATGAKQQESYEEHSYRCLNCEYIHIGEKEPEVCPVCGLSGEHFERYMTKTAEKNTSSFEHIVILGGGIAALSAVETLRENSDTIKITLISGEEKLPYYRLNLTRFLGNLIAEDELCIHPQYWYDEKRINVYKKKLITSILPESKEIILQDNERIAYDKLICAIGAHPFIPPIEGVSQEGVLTIRSVEDVHAIINAKKEIQSIVVIGGGVLGLETAGALAGRGYKVTVAEGAPWLMPRQLNQKAATYVEKSLAEIGVKVEYDFRTKKIVKADSKGLLVEGADGRALQGDLVILTTGVRPNTYLARKANLEVNQGLVVNNYMCTSDSNIYAAGDVTEHYGVTYGLWNIARYQGIIAAMNVLGKKVAFGGVPRSNALKVLDIDLFSIGDFMPQDASYTLVEEENEGNYILFAFRDQFLVGSIAIGYKTITHTIKKSVESKQHFTQEQIADVAHILDAIS